jgi:NADPH2:quinone reductase
MAYLACRVSRDSQGLVSACMSQLELSDLLPGELRIRAAWSGINFKDALGVTGRAPIYKRFPITAGIDVSGVVEASGDSRFSPGDPVLVNGMGMGEARDGGFAEFVQVPADWVVPLPAGLDLRQAMVLGTAGFTAALALQRMETNGQRPELGPVVVTGATGGVGSAAVSMLAARGYRVVAVSGRPEHHGYLEELGAAEVTTPEALGLGGKPLEASRYGGVIDNVGGPLLAGLLRHVALWGNVAAVGNAAGPTFEATVFPFILRGVSLLGASSMNCPMPLRISTWNRLGADLTPPALDRFVSRVVPLREVIGACGTLMNRTARGRVLVDCRS